jgi:hypothetical protein
MSFGPPQQPWIASFWTWDWLITPAAAPVIPVPTRLVEEGRAEIRPGRPEWPPETPTPFDQNWLLVMSGVVSAGPDQDPVLGDWSVLKGTSTSNWLATTVKFLPGDKEDSSGGGGGQFSMDSGTRGEGPLYYAINNYFRYFPDFPGDNDWDPVFTVERAVSFVGLSQIYDKSTSIDAGYSVGRWGLTEYASFPGYHAVGVVPNVFTGIWADIGVRDSDAWIMKLSFQITLLGKVALVILHE